MERFVEKYGNLIKIAKEGRFDAITHGCNCCKDWGAGIALSMKKSFPLAFQNDLNTPSTMGDITICKDYECCDVINSYTQFYKGKNKWGKDSDFNRYRAIESCMRKINEQYKGKIIGVPLIGCGKAGLKWNKVKKILKKELKDCYVVVVHYKP
jgi:O-acetyl-ADP-ribose deacetylase (regulator of RNase III)